MGNFLNSIFIQILNMSITASYCIVAVLLIRLVFNKLPRKYLYLLWLIVGFRLLCPVSVSTEFSIFNLNNFSENAPVNDTGKMQYIPENIQTLETKKIYTGIDTADHLINHKIPNTTAHFFLHLNIPKRFFHTGNYSKTIQYLLHYGAYIWVTGWILFLLFFVVSWQKLRQKLKMAVRLEENIYESDEISSPFVLGMLKPNIYLPCYMEESQKEMILLHEQYHIKRKDYLVKPMAFLLLSFYWFQPLMWMAWFGMCKDMEMSCDEKVLTQLGEERKKEYSLALLSFASTQFYARHIPLAFGENNAKSRIQHALRFHKPTIVIGILSILILAAAWILFGTNANPREENKENPQQEEQTNAKLLYQSKNPYIGDASADAEVIAAIAQVLPSSPFSEWRFKMRLQTSEEPYEFHFLLEDTPTEEQLYLFEESATLMIALIDNLNEVQCHYTIAETSTSDADAKTGYAQEELKETSMVKNWTPTHIQERYGIEDIKGYGTSEEKIQELLDMIEENRAEEFGSWYANLPYELYEEAVPYNENPYATDRDYMVILAESEDKMVTIYGMKSQKYGTRGITVDYHVTKEDGGNHNYFDWEWNEMQANAEVHLADYNQDGRDEIAFRIVDGTGTGVHCDQLVIFETHDSGTVEPFIFTDDMKNKEIEQLVDVSIDTNNKQVHILNKKEPQSSVPYFTMSYADSAADDGGEAVGADFYSIYDFVLDEDKIWLDIHTGIFRENYASATFADDWVIRFQVLYNQEKNNDFHLELSQKSNTP